jgi:hypothetical protein
MLNLSKDRIIEDLESLVIKRNGQIKDLEVKFDVLSDLSRMKDEKIELLQNQIALLNALNTTP